MAPFLLIYQFLLPKGNTVIIFLLLLPSNEGEQNPRPNENISSEQLYIFHLNTPIIFLLLLLSNEGEQNPGPNENISSEQLYSFHLNTPSLRNKLCIPQFSELSIFISFASLKHTVMTK